MTAAELHVLFVANRALIAETWNFFVTVHMGVIGLMFLARGNAVPFFARLLVLPGYAAFMYINYRAQIDNYDYTARILEALRMIDVEDGAGRGLTSMFQAGWVTRYLPVIYGIAALFSLLVMFVSYFADDRRADRQAGVTAKAPKAAPMVTRG
ncbi:MAG: hypothetical protein SGJ21_16440 [Alphaproteobacteria bacterium]|nr:hypothetical protein [Alphaproteobacteria bacterium]